MYTMDDSGVSESSGSWIQALEGGDGTAFRPFGVHWLDSALQETLLPGTPWEQVGHNIKIITHTQKSNSSRKY